MTLPERVLALHRALERGGVSHAFGGAIALAYATADPRGTSDIDVNLFVPAGACEPALTALPRGVEVPDGTAEAVARDGQVRVWWGETPLDLFFDYEPIHREAARHARRVPFAGDSEIPVLAPVELAVFKAVFDRTRDWADIEAMLAAGTLDAEATLERLGALVGPDDPRAARLARLGEGPASR